MPAGCFDDAVTLLPMLTILTGVAGRDEALLDGRRSTVERWRGPTDAATPRPGVRLLETGSRARTITVTEDHEISVCSSAAVTSLYVARGPHIHAVSTHAVDASLAAFGRADLDPVAVACVGLLGFSTSGTILAGVEAVPVRATVVIDDAGVSWKAGSQLLAPVASGTAYEDARDGLLETVREAVAGGAKICLTAGLDSRVVLAAARTCGSFVDTLTWGTSDSPDAVGAAALAARVGVRHQVVPIRLAGPRAAGAVVADELRNSEGVRPPLPPGFIDWSFVGDDLITGAGGETGRAFYSKWEWMLRRHPRSEDLVEAIVPVALASEISPSVLAAVRERVSHALTTATTDGFRGWCQLDHFYATQRLPLWGRAMLPPVAGVVTGAFLGARTQAALASLPMREKAGDGFHHRLLAEIAPDLTIDAPPGPREGVPPLFRRAARAARRRLRPSDGRWPLAPLINGHAWSTDFMRTTVLGSPITESVLTSEALTRAPETWVSGATGAQLLFGLSGPAALLEELERLGLCG